MQIRVLGCSGSIAAGSRTTAFLVDDDILIDAGTGVGDLTLEELARVDHIFVTHSHLDHVVSIGLLADSVTRLRVVQKRPPITVYALASTIAALQAHIFNGVIWPDFTKLPDRIHPVLRFSALEQGQVVELGGRHIEALPASHTVPAVGYAVTSRAGACWAFTGDTEPHAALWQRLAALQPQALVIETAFRDEEHALARVSKHLCPMRLMTELQQLPKATRVYITHIKPGEVDAVMTEIAALRTAHRISGLSSGQLVSV